MVAGMGWLLWLAVIGRQPVGAYVVASLFSLGGVLIVYFGIRALINPPPILVIDRQGIVVDARRSRDVILWSDLKGAHIAVIEGRAGYGLFAPKIRWEIVALELVDPRAFYERLDADKPRWLGRDTGVRPDHYPISCESLSIEAWQLSLIVRNGIERQGRLNPDPIPQTTYQPFFYRSPGRLEFAIVVTVVAALVAFVIMFRPSSWIEVRPNCEVHNIYRGKYWRQVQKTATWSGSCADDRAQGTGTLEWFHDGRLRARYDGEMERGRMTGRGEFTERNVQYEGTWNDGELQEGIAKYPDGRRFEGRWYRGRWTKGVLTSPGGRRMEGRWSEGRLSGWGVAQGPEGRFEGYWNSGVPQGTGTFVAPDGERYEGKWREGKPVDAESLRPEDLKALHCLWSAASVRFGDGFSGDSPVMCRAN